MGLKEIFGLSSKKRKKKRAEAAVSKAKTENAAVKEQQQTPAAEAEKTEQQSAAESKKKLGFFARIKALLVNNMLFLTFCVVLVLNSFLLRCFTIKFGEAKNAAQGLLLIVKPVLADLVAVNLIGALGFLFRKQKVRFRYFMVWTVILSILATGNSIFYRQFKSFLSVSQLSTAQVLGGVMDAVYNIIKPKDFLLLLPIPVMIIAYQLLKRKRGREYLDTKQSRAALSGYAGSAVILAGCCAVLFSTMLTKTDCSRLIKQWNRESVMSSFGMYVYHISDTVSSVHSKLNLVFGYEESKKKFDEFFDPEEENTSPEVKDVNDKPAEEKANEYSDIFKGKNVLVIHCESMQQFMMDTYFNGEPVAPNLQKLAKEGLYFSNFYAQESVGTSSDSEFTFATSLMPASSGTVAINYWDRDYVTTQKMLKEQGYYVFAMHGNNGSYWNRLNLHKSLGYDKLYHYTTDYVIDETIGLGLSDKSFFRQSVPKLKEIDKEHEKWYGALLMLTNHTPFTDIERVSDFDVTFKFKQYDEETGMYEEVSRSFLDGKKLGSYMKSAHYADEALGQLMANLDSEGLLDNTVVVLYGDHDAKIKEDQYEYYYNYEPFSDTVLTEEDDGYIPVDDFYYNLNRKTPFIIWCKDGGYEPKEITKVMGMYDVQPTLGNMFGFSNEFAMGHDIFSIPDDEENIVICPNGNFITDKVYYDAQKDSYFDRSGYENVAIHASCNQEYKDDPIPMFSHEKEGLYKFNESIYSAANADMRKNDGCVDDQYIRDRSQYAADRIDVSNSIIYYDIINKVEDGFGDQGIPTAPDTSSQPDTMFAPPDSITRKRIRAA